MSHSFLPSYSMTVAMFRVVYLISLFSVILAKHELYDGHSVFEVIVNDSKQEKQLIKIEENLNLDVWSESKPFRPGQVLVPLDKRQQFQNALEEEGLKYNVRSENVKELLDLEDKLLAESSRKSFNRSAAAGLPFDRIYTYEEVYEYLENLEKAYPDVVTLVNAGKSFEGRDVKYLKLSTTGFKDERKPVVFIESVLHAREWITLPATLYAIHKLVIDVTEIDLINNIDWIILPIANPDGYVYTHTTSRLWRKNRATGYSSTCNGVDLNRNFDVDWSIASSPAACTETFHGRHPFSEPETAIIRDIHKEHSHRTEFFVDVHSFGSYILYGYGTGHLPSNIKDVHNVGIEMGLAIDAVKTSWNPNYTIGNVATVLYKASGSSADYAQAIGVPLSYTYELPGRRNSGQTLFGFLVDPDFIEQAGFETWEGLKLGARYALKSYKLRRG